MWEEKFALNHSQEAQPQLYIHPTTRLWGELCGLWFMGRSQLKMRCKIMADLVKNGTVMDFVR